MIRRPPSTTRADTPLPYTTLCRSQPAAGRHESGRRRGRVVVDQVQGLEAAGFAGVEALLERTERGIETAVEAEQEARAVETRARLQHLLQVEVDGLLAEHRLADRKSVV